VESGYVFVHTGTFIAAITTDTDCMAITDGSGANIGALEHICIDCVFCGGSGTLLGAISDPTGIFGGAITITNAPDGSGAAPGELEGICTAYASTSGGMALVGELSDRTGISTVVTTTTIACTEGPDGHGEVTDALVCISTVFASSIATTKDIGVVFAHTGDSTSAITTTGQRGGSGANIAVLGVTGIVCAS
jgi:hypothetical protein